MSKIIEVYDLPKGEYRATRDRDVAIFNGYIGETVLQPTELAKSIGALFGRSYKPALVFFYGHPDEYLSKLFGWD